MKLFAVVGMHRSGTSVIARILNLLGADLGPSDDLMAPKPDNPTGFWESLAVTRLHDDLFADLGGRWDRPPVLEPGWQLRPSLKSRMERIRQIVTSHFESAQIAAWKDPRGSLLLPLWRRIVPINKTILCLRCPDDVASSLAAREGMASEQAAALWLRYIVAAWLDDASKLVVYFDEAYERPLELTRRLAHFVGLPAPSDDILGEVIRFVNPALRHDEVHGPAGPLMRLARAAHRMVTDGRPEVITPFFVALSDGWRLEAHLAREAVERRALRGDLVPSVLEILQRGDGNQ